jgi:hypothetical protein
MAAIKKPPSNPTHSTNPSPVINRKAFWSIVGVEYVRFVGYN